MADRVWGGPRRGTVADLFARADAIGTPPGVPGHALPGTLTGTPYGTSPAWGDLPNTYDKVFDGDPSTFFDFAEPSGGYAGIDLGAGHASPVAAIRFVPRNGQLGRMVGGRFEGCTDGPASGCRTLATVRTMPVLGWNELTVADTRPVPLAALRRPRRHLLRRRRDRVRRPRPRRHGGRTGAAAPARRQPGRHDAIATPAFAPSTTSGSTSAPTPPTTAPLAPCRRPGRRTSLSCRRARPCRPVAGRRPAVGGDRHLRPGRARQLPAAAGRGRPRACERVRPRALGPALGRRSIATSSISTPATPRTPRCGSPTTPRARSRSAGPTTGRRPPTPASRWRRRRAR